MKSVSASQRIPTYKELLIPFAANESHVINRLSNVLTILDVSGGPFQMSINEGEESDIRAGITFKMPENQQMRSIRFRETGGSTGNIRVALADGEIFDSRSSVSGNIAIVNAASPNESIQVDLLAADPGIAALITALQASVDLRSRLTDLSNAAYTFRESEGSEQTIVAAGANTNGIILHLCTLMADDSSSYYYVGINDGATKIICGWENNGGASNAHMITQVRDIFIPAGVALVSRVNSGNGGAALWYEVL